MGAIVKIPDLVELAVGIDANQVNPDLLKTTLLAIVNHLSLKDLKVEFKGSDGKKISDMIKNTKNANLKNINIQSSTEISVKESKESMGQDYLSSEKISEADNTIIVESGIVQEPARKRIVSYASFSRLESKVKNVQALIEALNAQVLPTDDALLQATRSKQDAKPISDLMQSLNITKRMTGAEEGLDKLASLLETVAKEYSDLRKIIEQIQEELGEDVAETMKQIKMAAKYAKQIRPREELLGGYRKTRVDETTSMGDFQNIDSLADSSKLRNLTTKTTEEGKSNLPNISKTDSFKITTSSKDVQAPPPQSSQSGSSVNLQVTNDKQPQSSSMFSMIPKFQAEDKIDPERLNKLLAQHEYMRKNMEYLTAQINTLADFADHILPEILAGMPHATELRKRIADLQKDTKPACPDGPEDNDDIIVTSRDMSERIEGAEAKLVKHQAKLKRQDLMIAEKTMDIDSRIGKLTKTLGDVVDVLGLRKHKNKDKGEEEMDNVFGKIGNIEEALIEIGCATQNLLDDKEYKMTLIENITEEMKLLKTLKLDRFEMEDILANKADCDELNKKVTLDRFDEVTNDLARGIDEAANKVSAHESVLTDTINELQKSIETKFDKDDLEMLKDDINADMQALKAEVVNLTAMKEGRVAAGAKTKFLTNVNCLSCDRNVSMATTTGVPCIPELADLTHMRTIRPFITYELEYLRKMKIKDPDVIKYIEYEELFRRYKLKNTDTYDHLAHVPHLKTRYCGGSHTVTGPQQKVPHTGHFEIKNPNNHKHF